MKLCIPLLALVVILPMSLRGQAGGNNLEGCINPNAIAEALTKLHKSNWRDVSLDQLRAIWPAELAGKDCDPGGCRDVWSEDRIISGHCQCCATFTFRIQGVEAKPRTEWLDNIVINYRSRQRSKLVVTARKFAAALGLRQDALDTVGTDSVQNFHWETSGGPGRELSAIELRFVREGHEWELYLNSGQNIAE